MAAPRNVYAHSRTENEFDLPAVSESAQAYTMPTGDAPYNDTFGWAPNWTPDPSRMGSSIRREYRPDMTQPSDKTTFYEELHADDQARANYNKVRIGTPITELRDGTEGLGANRWARNPREIPPAENRWTQRTNPRTYFFNRQYEDSPKHSAERFTGVHFSMADHRRDYPVMGMAPAKTRRNTFRLEPTPWDTNVVDIPASDPTPDYQPVMSPDVTNYGAGRSWRLT